MKRSGLGRGLAFAVVAGLGALAWLPLAGPRFGPALALALYVWVTVPAWLLWMAPGLRQGLRAAASGLLASLALLLVLGLGPAGWLAASVVALALGRALLGRQRTLLRSLALEALLLVTGAALGRALLGAGTASVAWALWGFYLVQALWPLIGAEQVPADEPPDDRFELASGRLTRTLEQLDV